MPRTKSTREKIIYRLEKCVETCDFILQYLREADTLGADRIKTFRNNLGIIIILTEEYQKKLQEFSDLFKTE